MAKILVVEDDRWIRCILVELLEMRGHDVLAASSVDTAREQLGQAPQIVLLDINIPGGGGEVLLREIRASSERATLPVIALTASAMFGDSERFVRQGFTAYLSKPFDVSSFGATVERYVQATS
ncbi:MAG TPA: response regulator [Kofleriaceae bacterium]